jgi:hypothetical protein
MMLSRAATALLLWSACLPAAVAAEPGTIVASIANPDGVRSVAAIDRASGRRIEGEIDGEAGTITVGRLPLGAAYDLAIDFRSGARLEGVDLGVPASDYVEEQPLLEEDVATIQEKVGRMNKFEDQIDVLAVVGNVQHAAVLMSKLRTRPFYMSKPGEVVWRCELWRFERPEDTWVKVQEELFTTLYWERLPGSVFAEKNITFDARLGGLRPTTEANRIELGTIEPPPEEPGVRLRDAAVVDMADDGDSE